jgi:hypothetical protein
MANRQLRLRPRTLIEAFAMALACDCTAGRSSFFYRPAPAKQPRILSPKQRADDRERAEAEIIRMRAAAAAWAASAPPGPESPRERRLRAKAEAAQGRARMETLRRAAWERLLAAQQIRTLAEQAQIRVEEPQIAEAA